MATPVCAQSLEGSYVCARVNLYLADPPQPPQADRYRRTLPIHLCLPPTTRRPLLSTRVLIITITGLQQRDWKR
jgi:hypothetical protein